MNELKDFHDMKCKEIDTDIEKDDFPILDKDKWIIYLCDIIVWGNVISS